MVLGAADAVGAAVKFDVLCTLKTSLKFDILNTISMAIRLAVAALLVRGVTGAHDALWLRYTEVPAATRTSLYGALEGANVAIVADADDPTGRAAGPTAANARSRTSSA